MIGNPPNISAEELLQEKCDHEAGHLAMLHALGLVFIHRYTIVVPDASAVRGGCFSFDSDPYDLQQDIFVGLAGMAAQGFGICSRTNKTLADPDVKDRVWRNGVDDRAEVRRVHKVENPVIMARWQDVLGLMNKIWPMVSVLSSHLKAASHHIIYHEEPTLILCEGPLDRYRNNRVSADPGAYNRDDFPQVYPGVPFYESAAETFARLEQQP